MTRQARHSLLVVEVQTVAHGLPANRPIHGAAVDVAIAKLRRHSPGDGSFACSGWSINREDEPSHEMRVGSRGDYPVSVTCALWLAALS